MLDGIDVRPWLGLPKVNTDYEADLSRVDTVVARCAPTVVEYRNNSEDSFVAFTGNGDGTLNGAIDYANHTCVDAGVSIFPLERHHVMLRCAPTMRKM